MISWYQLSASWFSFVNAQSKCVFSWIYVLCFIISSVVLLFHYAASHAPPPAPVHGSSGGSMLGGFGATIAQGMHADINYIYNWLLSYYILFSGTCLDITFWVCPVPSFAQAWLLVLAVLLRTGLWMLWWALAPFNMKLLPPKQQLLQLLLWAVWALMLVVCIPRHSKMYVKLPSPWYLFAKLYHKFNAMKHMITLSLLFVK